MKANSEILREVENYIAQINIPVEPERLYSPIRYTLAEGGKRLRPMLTMLANQIYCESTADALPVAVAIEVFHNFTLLHDDIMDNADTRRGKPSVYAKWGENVAILSGDVMMILAYKLLSKAKAPMLPKVLEVFNEMAAEVCEGQQYDIDFETQPKVSVTEYMHMIELKTSVLLGGATLIGAILGGAPSADCAVLQRFATELGLAFQLQDDLLDTYGDEKLGKMIGGDILEGKQTFLKIMAFSRADQPTRKILASAHLDATLSDEEKIAKVKGIYDSLDIKRATEQQIATKFERALSLLEGLVSSGAVEEERVAPLREYARGLMNREK
ncbi:MAG: polyprenyl synthetase family protein [Rikenellaceae bacterium]